MRESPQSPGAVRSFTRDSRALVLDCAGPQVQAVVLSPHLVRVRLAPDGTFAPRRSWAVAPPDDEFAEAPFQLREDEKALTLNTGKLTVRIDKDTCAIAFVDPHGVEFCADAPGLS